MEKDIALGNVAVWPGGPDEKRARELLDAYWTGHKVSPLVVLVWDDGRAIALGEPEKLVVLHNVYGQDETIDRMEKLGKVYQIHAAELARHVDGIARKALDEARFVATERSLGWGVELFTLADVVSGLWSFLDDKAQAALAEYRAGG